MMAVGTVLSVAVMAMGTAVALVMAVVRTVVGVTMTGPTVAAASPRD
jgi:hypothetical protein